MTKNMREKKKEKNTTTKSITGVCFSIDDEREYQCTKSMTNLWYNTKSST